MLANEGYRVATADRYEAVFGMPPFDPCVVISDGSDVGMRVVLGRARLANVSADDVPVITVTGERARLVSGMPGAFRVFGKTEALAGVLSAMADAPPSQPARPAFHRLWNSLKQHSSSGGPLGQNMRPSSTAPRRRDRIATVSFFSSLSPWRRSLLTLTVVSSVILVWRLAPHLTHDHGCSG